MTAWSNCSAGLRQRASDSPSAPTAPSCRSRKAAICRSLPGLDVFVAWMGAKSYPTAVPIARKLRDAGFAVELPPEEMKFKKSLGLADKLGARYALIIGEDEVASGTYTLKRLADAEQKKLTECELLEHLAVGKKAAR